MVLAQCPSAEPLCDFRPAVCLSADNVELIELELDINDPAFSAAMADWLHAEVEKATA